MLQSKMDRSLWCLFVFLFCSFLTVFFPPLYSMENLKVGSLNMNGGRARERQTAVVELMRLKRIDVLFLQETHSTADNEADWSGVCPGAVFLSHGTHVSAGVSMLFSQRIAMSDVAHVEVERGRLHIVHGTWRETHFVFVNIYAHNSPANRVQLFHSLDRHLKRFSSNSVVIVGGDWNSTTHPQDRTSEEPHLTSASLLASIVQQNDLTDAWRQCHPTSRQYTWVRASGGRVSAARLDRLYINKTQANRVKRAHISPVAFSDHHLVTLDCAVPSCVSRCPYWRLNVRLLQDVSFCQAFRVFWEQWRLRKAEFESILKWWEVGKAQIKAFVQQYTANTQRTEKGQLEQLEREVTILEQGVIRGAGSTSTWANKKVALRNFMNERAKGALVKARVASLSDIDAPTRYFFRLE